MQNLEELAAQGARIYQKIRDIKYVVGGTHDPTGIYEDGFGTCSRKHLKLKSELESLGYKIKIRISYFDWKSLPFPDQVSNIFGNDAIEPHMTLYFKLGRYEGVIDLTFDKALERYGFTVKEWDGMSDIGSSVTEIGPARIYDSNLLWLRGKASAAIDFLKNLGHRYRGEQLEQERWAMNVNLINGYLESIRLP